MKINSIIRLAVKNLYYGFTRFILTVLSITMVSIIIILLSNFMCYFKLSLDNDIYHYCNDGGISINLEIERHPVTKAPLIDALEVEVIDDFIEQAYELNILHKYRFNYKDTNSHTEKINLLPYLGGAEPISDAPSIIQGSTWDYQDIVKNYILLSEEASILYDKNINDNIIIDINNKSHEFIVKGIVSSRFSYIDYSYFDNTFLLIESNPDDTISTGIFKELKKLKRTAPENYEIAGSARDYIDINNSIFLVVTGVTMFLMILCVALGIGCIINTMRVNINSNNKTIGMMKAIGMKNKDIFLYIFLQGCIIIAISTIIATIISWVISKYILKLILENIYVLIGFGVHTIQTGFSFLFPIINLIIFIIVIYFCVNRLLNRYFSMNAIRIMERAD